MSRILRGRDLGGKKSIPDEIIKEHKDGGQRGPGVRGWSTWHEGQSEVRLKK